MAFAVWSAANTGQVTVISLGRTETTHVLVPWWRGWARFASAPVLVLALYAYHALRGAPTVRALVSTFLAASGVGMLCYSQWFTSVSHAFFFYGFFGYVLFAYFVDLRFGRPVATGLLVATVAVLLYIYAAA